MKLFFDFFPILCFFIAYKLYDIYVATIVAIVSTFLQVGYSWFRFRKVEPMHLVTLVIMVVFGGLTLYLQDERFIKWKPTVVNWLFATAFLFSQWVGKKPLIERLLEANVGLPTSVWRILNLCWIVFFILMGAANLLVAFSYDTSTWVNFKLFGMFGLTLLFLLIQSFYLSKYLQEPTKEE
jgi:intracellular septation protein